MLQSKEPITNSFPVVFGYVLPEDGAHVLKHGGDTHFMFVLIKNVHLVGK
jgi:hypothetical protein